MLVDMFAAALVAGEEAFLFVKIIPLTRSFFVSTQ